MVSAIMIMLFKFMFCAVTVTLPFGAYIRPLKLTFVPSNVMFPFSEQIMALLAFTDSLLIVMSLPAFSEALRLKFQASFIPPDTSMGELMFKFISSFS